MMNNERCSETLLRQALYDSCRRNVQGQHLLCIQDTTEVSYFAHKQRISKLNADTGRLNNINYGYFCHPMLVVDPEKELPLGFSSVKLWNRTWEKPDQAPRAYKKLPIEKKESFRWIDSVTQSRKNLPENVSITVIADRESDIYKALCTIPRANTHLLVRSSSDRLLCQEGVLLSDKMRSCGVMPTYSVKIKGNKSRKSRTALIDMRYTSVELKRTAATIGDYPISVKMNYIYISERPSRFLRKSRCGSRGSSCPRWREKPPNKRIPSLQIRWHGRLG